MDDTSTQDRQSSDHDLYAALMLSSLLDSQQNLEEQQEESAQLNNEKIEIDSSDPDVIWVPADKHPEIAPTEFAKFIKTHGANTPTRKNASIHRRKSILSQSLSAKPTQEDNEKDLNRTLSEKKRHFLENVMNNQQQKVDVLDSHTFDRNSTAFDDSRIIAPKNDKSLLRRSAFSARGRSRKSVTDDREQAKQRRALSQRKPSSSGSLISQESNKSAKSWNKAEGVSLFDQPVNMSEWIDLGSASLESDDSQRGILSRVHDAESQLSRSQHNVEEVDVKEEKEIEPVVVVKEEKVDDTPIRKKSLVKNNTKPSVALESPKRPGIIRSETSESNLNIPTLTNNTKNPMQMTNPKVEKRSSWLSGLFQNTNSKKPTSTVNTVIQSTTTHPTAPPTSSSPLSGLATLFTRSLSMKSHISTNTGNTTHSKYKSSTLPTTKKTSSTNTTTTTTNNTINTTTTPNSKMKRSSRLEIPPPSERTFFNSNRLPLHVERAIYRLSHMKLADPRRPLRQQVLISNLMFWYLSIQQNDFQQQQEEQRIEAPDIQQQQPNSANKKANKMTRLIHSAKRRKNELVQATSGSGFHPETTTTVKKTNNVQFSLAPIPNHHYPILNFEKQEDEEDEDLPLSQFRVNH